MNWKKFRCVGHTQRGFVAGPHYHLWQLGSGSTQRSRRKHLPPVESGCPCFNGDCWGEIYSSSWRTKLTSNEVLLMCKPARIYRFMNCGNLLLFQVPLPWKQKPLLHCQWVFHHLPEDHQHSVGCFNADGELSIDQLKLCKKPKDRTSGQGKKWKNTGALGCILRPHILHNRLPNFTSCPACVP